MENKNLVKEAITALKEFGANIMPMKGYGEGIETKNWWVEDNGIWGLAERVPMGMYLDDEEIIELAEQYTSFQPK